MALGESNGKRDAADGILDVQTVVCAFSDDADSRLPLHVGIYVRRSIG